MDTSKRRPSTYEVLRANGVDRRTFLSFCTKTTALLGLSAAMVPQVVKAFVTQPRIPVIWLHGLECTGCSESILRSSNPTIAEVILNLVSLDYHLTLQTAAGFQAEGIRQRIMRESSGQYLLAVEGGTPTSKKGAYCTIAGGSFVDILKETAAGARAIIAWGACASYGGVQAAQPNPTGTKPVSALIKGTPVINIPGCPPIAEVMTGVIAYILTSGSLPDLDSENRPIMYYGSTVHDTCTRKSFFDASQFVKSWDDSGARSGWCLYQMGCRGPATHNACSDIMWNEGVSFCPHAGHPCIGCSERGFWGKESFYGESVDREHEDDAVEARIGG